MEHDCATATSDRPPCKRRQTAMQKAVFYRAIHGLLQRHLPSFTKPFANTCPRDTRNTYSNDGSAPSHSPSLQDLTMLSCKAFKRSQANFQEACVQTE